MSKAIVVLDNHFVKLSDGRVLNNGIVSEDFLKKYSQYYSEVYFLGRTVHFNEDELGSNSEFNNYKEVKFQEGEEIFNPLPMFRNLQDLGKKYIEIKRIVKNLLNSVEDARIILRVPSLLSSIVYFSLPRSLKNKVIIECVADLSQVTPSMTKSAILKNKILSNWTKKIAAKAFAASYVTKYALQEVYPAKRAKVKSHYSSIDLKDDFYFKREIEAKSRWKIVHVSTLNQNTKGHSLLLKLCKKLVENSYNIEVDIVGGGRYKNFYENEAKDLGISQHVNFLGNISNKEDLRKIYINSDLMIFPTEFEGLPRVLIEAMACSLPCIATNVNGIPELLQSEDMFNVGDFDGFYNRAVEYLESLETMKQTSARNFEIAQNYEYKKLQNRRLSFFKTIDENWR